MKVLIIGSRIPFPLHDGGAIATFNMLKGLSHCGIETTFISLNTHKHFVDDSTLKKEFPFLKALIPFKINTGISLWGAIKNLFGNSSYNIDRFYNTDFEQFIVQQIKNNAYDIIHFEGLFVAPYIAAVQLNCTTPTLLRQHNIEFQIWERLAANEKNPLKKWYLHLLATRIKQFELDVLPKFSKIVTIAHSDEVLIQQLTLLNHTQTIPGGFEINLSEASHGPLIPNSMYHIGSMEWLPNRQAMEWFYASVWPLVIKEMPFAKFYMAGKNMPLKYKEWESDNFHVLGQVKNAAEFANDKEILIVPLQSGSGIRMKMIEAMLQGKAVITTQIGAQGLPVINKVHCLIADTETDFSQAILALLRDEAFRKSIAEKGKSVMIEHFENTKISEQWKLLYESMLH